jgi:hypothetical protein
MKFQNVSHCVHQIPACHQLTFSYHDQRNRDGGTDNRYEGVIFGNAVALMVGAKTRTGCSSKGRSLYNADADVGRLWLSLGSAVSTQSINACTARIMIGFYARREVKP